VKGTAATVELRHSNNPATGFWFSKKQFGVRSVGPCLGPSLRAPPLTELGKPPAGTSVSEACYEVLGGTFPSKTLWSRSNGQYWPQDRGNAVRATNSSE